MKIKFLSWTGKPDVELENLTSADLAGVGQGASVPHISYYGQCWAMMKWTKFLKRATEKHKMRPKLGARRRGE